MRCMSYDDQAFFREDGTLKVEPEQAFETVDEYVAWLNHGKSDWLFVAPDDIKTVAELGAYLDGEHASNMRKSRWYGTED